MSALLIVTVVQKDDDLEMTPKRLIKICRRKEQYETPELNDALYLNHEGFSSIKNLEPYINVKSLFLDGNMLSKILLSKLLRPRGFAGVFSFIRCRTT